MVSENPNGPDTGKDIQREILDFWDSCSDTLNRDTDGELLHNRWVSERLNDLFPNAHNLRIADIGTGTGFLAISFAQLGHKVTATDLSTKMLDHARNNAVKRGLDIEFLQDDAEDTRLPPDTFDLISLRDVLYSFIDPLKTLIGIIGLLRPGGFLMISDGNYFRYLHDPSYSRREDYFRMRDGIGEYCSMCGFSVEEGNRLAELFGNLEKSRHTGPGWETDLLLKKSMNNIRIRCDDPLDYHQLDEHGRMQVPFRYSVICQKPYYGPDGTGPSGRFDKSHLYSGQRTTSDELAHCFTALSDENRIRLLEHLLGGHTTVSELAGSVGLSVNKTSYHLNVLKDVGLVGSEKDGRTVRYSVSDEGAVEYLLRAVSGVFKIR
ncbi:MAG: metalloregulator ArsR/SmtB family transcription factor [archaeon]|nr:metalloregulator ArsR/SmtB family transcription factor [archaeon]